MVEPLKKILCIEDDRETAALIVEELADRGFEPIVAYSGAEGFAELSNTSRTSCCVTSTCRSCRDLRCSNA
jgi:DNA-binding response OmpR family regulator